MYISAPTTRSSIPTKIATTELTIVETERETTEGLITTSTTTTRARTPTSTTESTEIETERATAEELMTTSYNSIRMLTSKATTESTITETERATTEGLMTSSNIPTSSIETPTSTAPLMTRSPSTSTVAVINSDPAGSPLVVKYVLHNNHVSKDDAANRCKREGGYLPVPMSGEENRKLSNFLTEVNYNEKIWLGLTKIEEDRLEAIIEGKLFICYYTYLI